MSRAARPSDVDEICGSLPETWFGTSWGDVPTWLVRQKDGDEKGRGFLLYRKPHQTAVDPRTGEPYEDLLVIRTPSPTEKTELVEGEGPFFTIPHFDNTNAVLVQLSRLEEIDRDELVEVVTDAWRTCAPPRLRKQHPDV